MLGAKKSKFAVAFGRVLRRLRNSKSYTQEGLALEAGIERNYVSLMERGINQPTVTILFKVAMALDESPSKMISLVEKELHK